MKKALVIPEAFRTGKWSVSEQASKSHGLTGLDREKQHNIMHIPMGNSPIEKFVRMHELSHAKWTPDGEIIDKYLDLDNPLINGLMQPLEDGRINYLMGKSGVEGIREGAEEFYESTFDRKGDLTVNADKDENVDHLLFIGTTTWMFMPDYFNKKRYGSRLKLLSQTKGTAHWHILKRIRKLYQRHADSFEKSTVPAVKLMMHLLPKENPKNPLPLEERRNEATARLIRALEDVIICVFLDKILKQTEDERRAQQFRKEEKLDKLIKDEIPETKSTIPTNTPRKKRNVQDFVDMGLPSKYVREQFMDDDLTERQTKGWLGDDYANYTWGTLSLEEAKLIKTISKKPAVKEVNSDEGSIIGQIYRAPIDGMIFTEIHKNYREGSVLIDCSGSMNISIQEIERIVKLCPGMIVAGYAGQGDKGVLRTFAKGGKMCDISALNLDMGGNIVDFPSLEWLAKQKSPRFWISDGNVTGSRERRSSSLIEQAFTFIANHKILRITDVKLLEEHFLHYRI